MKILFVTFGEISICGGYSYSILMALAEAGHKVDLVAHTANIPSHPHVRILPITSVKLPVRVKLKLCAINAAGRNSYDVMHTIDDAVVFAARLCLFRKMHLVYEASRCFSGDAGDAPSLSWKMMPTAGRKREKKILEQADVILTSCTQLSDDLRSVNSGLNAALVESIPLQSLVKNKVVKRFVLEEKVKKWAASIVVCSVFPGSKDEWNNTLMAARKVIDSHPRTLFIFRGLMKAHSEPVAGKLDIHDNCIFLDQADIHGYREALELATVAWMVPHSSGRYIHEEVYTLLGSSAPLVSVESDIYKSILSSENSIQVLSDVDSIAEGLIQAIREPLLSFAIAVVGQQLIADHFSLSSFKHKIRMVYHNL